MKARSIPNATHVTHVEGGTWIPWSEHLKENRHPGLRVHSIRFDNGRVWDAVNGWRPVSMNIGKRVIEANVKRAKEEHLAA